MRGEKSECPEIFDEADCYYLASEDRYYVTEPEKMLPFDEAAEECRKMGGELSRIDSPAEQAFLGGLASSQGSWLGMQKINNTFRWIPSTDEVVAGVLGVCLPVENETFHLLVDSP